MTRELTEKDRKVLKFEKRPGYVFSGLFLCFGGLFNLVYFAIVKTDPNYLMIGLIPVLCATSTLQKRAIEYQCDRVLNFEKWVTRRIFGYVYKAKKE